MKWRLPYLIGFSLLGDMVCQIALAHTYGRDRREQQSVEIEHNRSVGQIQNRLGFVGTAFLVEDDCTVMTNYHVAFAREKDPVTGIVKTQRGK